MRNRLLLSASLVGGFVPFPTDQARPPPPETPRYGPPWRRPFPFLPLSAADRLSSGLRPIFWRCSFDRRLVGRSFKSSFSSGISFCLCTRVLMDLERSRIEISLATRPTKVSVTLAFLLFPRGFL